MSARDALREKIFGAKATVKLVPFAGGEIEIRQPALGQILEMRTLNAEDPKAATVNMLIGYCFVPGTDETVFDEADYESILELPFNEDMQLLQVEIGKILGVNATEVKADADEATKTAA